MGSFTIDIKNFQSIGNANLVFEPGINMIVGQSNSGKSATLRAIRSTVVNPSRAKHYIKKGTNKATVTIDYNNDSVEWTRAAKESVYNINEETYEKVGNKTLFDLKEDGCGFVRDDAGNIMNIEGEWDLLFPFDRTPSELFKLFENIFCVSDSALILKSYKDEEAELVKRKGQYEDRLNTLNSKKIALEELEQEVDTDKIASESKIFEGLANDYFKMQEDSRYLQRCEAIAGFTVDEVQPPTENSLEPLIEMTKDYKFFMNVLQRRKFYKSLPETVTVSDSLERYIEIAKDYEVLEQAQALSKIDLSKECEISKDTLNNYFTLLEDMQFIENAKEASQFDLSMECEITNSLDEYAEVLADYKYLMGVVKKRRELKEKYDALTAKIADLEARLAEYKVCPLCGQTLKEGEEHVD